MTQLAANLAQSKSRGQIIFEYFLLVLSLCALALRITYPAGPDINLAGQPVNSSDALFDVTMSTLLIFPFCVWLLRFIFSKKSSYRFTGLEIGLCLFVAGAVVAAFFASDKRTAINDSIALLAPVLLAILLVQILDSNVKIIFVLSLIAALGIVCGWQCTEQFFVSNRIMIDQYKIAPETILGPLGIEPGSFDQMLLEHRLLSKDVRGFFTTGNSAGSFLLLTAFAALAVVFHNLKNKKNFVASLLVLAAIVFGLALTHSKGAIAAAILASLMFVLYLLFGRRLKAHKKAIVIICLFSFFAAGVLLVFHGLKYHRLPGGNSMLVRWQYWQASAKMYEEHFLTGVGPGNFAHLYPRYKLPASLETVTDPHNFLLTILTQFGPLGLIGFLSLIFIPLWKIVFRPLPQLYPQQGNTPKHSSFVIVFIIAVALLVVRPMFIKIPLVAETFEVLAYAILTLYVIPAFVFFIILRLLIPRSLAPDLSDTRTIAVLFCTLTGCLIHNLIDFALFEPGIFTTFMVLLACLITKNSASISFTTTRLTKILSMIIVILLFGSFTLLYFCPVIKSTVNIRKSAAAAAAGQFGKAQDLLSSAAQKDTLNPLPLSLSSRLYLNQFFIEGSNNADLLLNAQENLFGAIERNKADFKNYVRLTDVYRLLAELSQNKTDWLNKAFDAASQAIRRYPGSSQLCVAFAEIAEQLDRNDIALEHYKKAIEIEDAYRRQFEVMYPGKEIFSRLGGEKYNTAKQRVKELSKQLNR